jgi:hypothetical protein
LFGIFLMDITLPTTTPFKVTLLDTMIFPEFGKYAMYLTSPPKKLFPFRKLTPATKMTIAKTAIMPTFISFANFK